MESNAKTCESRDILSSRWRVFLLYWLPAIVIVVAGAPAVSNGWRTMVWAVGLGIMAAACIVNALHCQRVPLLLYWPILPPDGPRRAVLWRRLPASRRERLESAGSNSADRHHRSLVSTGNLFGEISEGQCWIANISESFSFFVAVAKPEPPPWE